MVPSLDPSELNRALLCTTFDEQQNRDEIRANTLAMTSALIGQKKPPARDIKKWQAQITNGQIDCNAIIVVRNRLVGTNQLIRLHTLLMQHGGWGGSNLYPQILDHVLDMNHEDSHRHTTSYDAISVQDSECLNAYLAHPAVDINKEILVNGYTLLDECFAVLEDHYSSSFPGLYRYVSHAYGHWGEKQAGAIARRLLARGAIMNQLLAVQVAAEPSDSPTYNIAKPFVDQWQQEWDDFRSGVQTPDTLSPAQLGHFYSLGHLADTLHAECWQGHEAEALHCYDQLPQWVQDREPCIDARRALALRVKPEALVAGWSIERDAEPLHESSQSVLLCCAL